MKKAVSIVLILMCALLALSACGKKNGMTKNSSANTCNGTWVCKEIPKVIEKSFSKVTFEIGDGRFTYTLTGDKNSTVTEGYVKETGNDSMVLYMDKQKQINNADNKVLQEKDVESSMSRSQPIYAKCESDGTMTITGDKQKMIFERVE
ncbi:MAG: hypothetical protein IIZ66_07380 [Clostridia bacterium]|nr:hypothetical protein [Clostridia bacterium]